ncbi:MAG TPA: hypothetical protein VGN11_12710 [Candidatus Baltobacteraceae bacterium]|jgi:uncharacterized FlaG/YvyC family protein|nr:hypothetical protein [Candidatus Baltobacteraceae bacterium]
MDVQPAPAAGANIVVSGTFGPEIAPAPPEAPEAAVAQTPAASQSGDSNGHAGIAPAIAKLFAEQGAPVSPNLNVSYRVLNDPDEIVTVFTDPRTGKEVTQIPSEALIGLAQFFDQQQGVTFDRNA